MESHAERCDRLAAAIRSASGGEVGLAKDTSNLFRDRRRHSKRSLDVSGFDQVLAIDASEGWVDAEGMATYEAIVARTLEHNLMPAVVPELKTITIGGAAAGVGIEASSFKYGLVHETLSELEILTGDGRILRCRPDNEYSDLFHGFPNSYGTFGYALRLRAVAVPVKPFVELTHRRFSRTDVFFDALAQACASDADFVDGVAFSPGELYLNVCRFCDRAAEVSRYTFEHIYYRSIREKERDWLTVGDFIWRWDTDWFWCSKNVGAQVPWVRRLYGRKRLNSKTYQRIMRWNSRWGFTRAFDRLRGGHSESVIQDVDIPLHHAARFLEFFQREIALAPVWICPVRPTAQAAEFLLFPMTPDQLYVNFGFWDVLRRRQRHQPAHFNRLIERKVGELEGIKSLYSESFYGPDEFSRIYGGESYRALKSKYDPHHVLPDLYAKCVQRA